jgi:cbb3-type cytochrome oxidase maturation protein
MTSLYLLISISFVFIVALLFLLYWSIHAGQFDDLTGPAESILLDDDLSNKN